MVDHFERVAIRLCVGARYDAEIAGFRIDCSELSRFIQVKPGDIVAKRPHLPASLRLRRYQHCKVRLAASRRKGGGEIMLFAVWTLDFND